MKLLRWIVPLLALLTFALPAHAQYNPAQGWCEDGNITAALSGLPSTNTLQGSYPLCTVTVLIHGGGAATLYSDSTGTPLANPFTANANGQWQFFTAAGVYDVTLTGGTPIALPAPVTFSYLIVSAGSGSVTSFSSGNLAPLFTTSVATATTTPALSFSLSTAAANKVLGNCTGSTAAPTYCTLTSAMQPAPGSDTQLIYNSSGLFAATSGGTWDNTNRRIKLVNGANTAFMSIQPGTISFNASGGTTAPYISVVFGAYDIIGGASDDINIGQSGNNHHLVLPGNAFGTALLGEASNAGIIKLNDGTSSAGVFQGPIIRASNSSPESSITANTGSLYLRTDGSATTSLYLKEPGGANTGWQPFAMQDDSQTLTNKTLPDTTTVFANTSALTKTMKIDLSGATAATRATLTFAQSASRIYTFPDLAGTVCLSTGASCNPLYDHSGAQSTIAHVVQDTCVLGTSCAVTLTGASVFSSSTSYTCTAQDATAAAATKVAQASGSGFTITGTGTDTIRYLCIGN